MAQENPFRFVHDISRSPTAHDACDSWYSPITVLLKPQPEAQYLPYQFRRRARMVASNSLARIDYVGHCAWPARANCPWVILHGRFGAHLTRVCAMAKSSSGATELRISSPCSHELALTMSDGNPVPGGKYCRPRPDRQSVEAARITARCDAPVARISERLALT